MKWKKKKEIYFKTKRKIHDKELYKIGRED